MINNIYVITFLISGIRFFINGFFCTKLYFEGNNNLIDKNKNSKSILLFSTLYTIILISLKCFLNSPIIPIVSFILLLGYFSYKIKNNWKFVFTYTSFLSLIIEVLHILSYKVVLILLYLLNTTDNSNDNDVTEELLIARILTFSFYIIFLFIIYKYRTKFLKLKVINKISNSIFIPIFMVLSLIVTIYIKFIFKSASSYWGNILCNIFLFLPITVVFIYIICNDFENKIYDLKTTIKKTKMITPLEEAKNRESQGMKGLYFIEEKYKSEYEYFQKKLKYLEMRKDMDGFRQISFCSVLLNDYEDLRRVNFSACIWEPVGKIVGISGNTVYRNIENAINYLWNSNDAEVQKNLNEYYTGKICEKRGAPTAKEFLIFLVSNYRKNVN